MFITTYNEASTPAQKALVTIRDLMKSKSGSLKLAKSNIVAIIEDIDEEYNLCESSIIELQKIQSERTFKIALFHLNNAFHCQLHYEIKARTDVKHVVNGALELIESSCPNTEIELKSQNTTIEATNMDMSQIEIDALMQKTTSTERQIIALEVLKSKSAIKDALKESHFEDVEKMFNRFNAVFEELKQQREEELRLQREALQKKKLDTALDALDVDGIGLTPEQILEQLAAKMGVSIKLPRSKSTSTSNAGTKKRKPQDKFVIEFINQSGDVDYIERITSGKTSGDLKDYLKDTGKKVRDLVIGRLMADNEEYFYTNEDSGNNVIDAAKLKTYLESIGKLDKLIESGKVDEVADARAALDNL